VYSYIFCLLKQNKHQISWICFGISTHPWLIYTTIYRKSREILNQLHQDLSIIFFNLDFLLAVHWKTVYSLHYYITKIWYSVWNFNLNHDHQYSSYVIHVTGVLPILIRLAYGKRIDVHNAVMQTIMN
jgi:hypothetical protein